MGRASDGRSISPQGICKRISVTGDRGTPTASFIGARRFLSADPKGALWGGFGAFNEAISTVNLISFRDDASFVPEAFIRPLCPA